LIKIFATEEVFCAMTILAQLWLEDHRKTTYDFLLEHRLQLPVTSRDKETAEHAAERIVFSETISDLFADMMDTGQIDTEIVLTTVRMPAPAVWIEWPHGAIRMGALLDEAPDWRIVIITVAGQKRRANSIIYAGIVDNLPMPKGDRGVHLGFANMGSVESHEQRQFFGGFVMEALFGLFLMQQPKVVRFEDVLHSSAIQHVRMKRGRLPLLEYRRVTVKVGAEERRARTAGQTNESEEITGHRRYHRVLGHFRVYGRETPDPRALWIDPYFRGDPNVGILLSERTLV
jgi:hypothetical protein